MNKFRYYDISFIIICASIFSFLNNYGYSELLSKYSVVLALMSYFVGKYVGRAQSGKKQIEE